MSSLAILMSDSVFSCGCPKKSFVVSSSLPPLVGGGGGLVCESVGKADLLSDHFDGKQSRESVSATHLPSVSESYLLCLQVE